MNNTINCEFLRAQLDNECVTYNEYLGTKADIAQVIYVIYVFVLSIWTLWYTIKIKKFKRLQRKMFIYIYVVLLSLAIRAIDPFSYRGWYPWTLTILLYDIATSAVYSMLITWAKNWLVPILTFSRDYFHWQTPIEKILIAAHTFVWLQFLTFSTLQTTVYPMWLWQSIKLGLGSLILLILIVVHIILGYNIFFKIYSMENERNRVSFARKHNPTTNVDLDEDIDESRENSMSISSLAPSVNISERHQAGARRSTATQMERVTTILKRSMSMSTYNPLATRVLKVCVWAMIGEGLSVVFQLFFILRLVSNKYTLEDNPPPPPENVNDIILEGIFDFIQGLAVFVVVLHFHHGEEKVKRASIAFKRNRASTLRYEVDDKMALDQPIANRTSSRDQRSARTSRFSKA